MKNYEILKKVKELKDEGYYTATCIEEKATGRVGTAKLAGEDIWVELHDEDDEMDEDFVSAEEFERDYEIIEVIIDDGEDDKHYTAEEFLA